VIRLPLLLFIVVAVAFAIPLTSANQARELVVCADPNNLPFSNRAGQGFENQLVQLLARTCRPMSAMSGGRSGAA
jgi:mxaJ protein